jgi:N-dimethylarginine dimethylaminohydrolase
LFRHYGYPSKTQNYIAVGKEDMHDNGIFHPNVHAVSSIYIGLNLLAISPDTLVVGKNQVSLHRKLRKHGFKLKLVSYLHARNFGGGIHCTSLPLDRVYY